MRSENKASRKLTLIPAKKQHRATFQHTPVLPPIQGSPMKPLSANINHTNMSPLRSPMSAPNFKKAQGNDAKKHRTATNARTGRNGGAAKDKKKENVLQDITARTANASPKKKPGKAANVVRTRVNREGGSRDRMKAFQRLKALQKEEMSDEEEDFVPTVPVVQQQQEQQQQPPPSAVSSRFSSPTSPVFETKISKGKFYRKSIIVDKSTKEIMKKPPSRRIMRKDLTSTRPSITHVHHSRRVFYH